ncbi:MAG TPA: MFS transporter [Thermomicrobiales bacterium]|nr:MFS transporter [Thermomicrobiales bacterium]
MSAVASERLRQSLGATFLALRHRNFRLFFIGQTISNSGNWLTNVALTLFVLSLTDSGVALGLLAACQYGPILLLSAWAGAIADRSDKRRLLYVTQSLEMTQSIGLAILAFTPHPPLAGLYALALCGGALLSFDNPLRRSFVTEMVPRADIPNAVVLYSLIVNISRIFGPTLAGLLVVSLGYGWCFTVDAISYLAVLACLFMMRPAELHRAPRRAPVKGAVREGLRYVRSLPALWIPFVIYAIIGLLAYNFTVTLPLFVTEALHGSDADFTAIYAIFSVGAVVGALVVARRVGVALRQIVRGAALLGFSLLLLAAAPSVRIAFPAALLVGVASIIYTTATTASVQVVARPDMQGRVLSLQFVLMGGGSAVGGPLLGWLADAAGARAVVVLGGAVCFAAAAFGALASREAASAPERSPAPQPERELAAQPKR